MNVRKCNICPRKCGIDRTVKDNNQNLGFCGADNKIKIAWFGKHFGEEPPISGPSHPKGGRGKGSGTIFFCQCNLKCVFCQNWQISWEWRKDNPPSLRRIGGLRRARKYKTDEVVKLILNLQGQGVENINLISPTPWAFWLKKVLLEAKKEGLRIPVIWNSNGYEDVGVLREIGESRVIDVYLPDYKYSDEKLAVKYSSAPDYPKIAGEAIMEMYRQVGDLEVDKNGIAKSGLIVRHLILPGQIENTINSLKFIRSVSANIHLSLMTQYNPLFKAKNFPEINRTLMKEEYEEVMKTVEDLEFQNGWIQEFDESVKCFTPDFKKENPFGK